MYKCLCCGNDTLPVPPEEAIAYICPVCWWENDVFTQSDDEPSDENRGVTLNQARKNVIEFGICDPDLELAGSSCTGTWKLGDRKTGSHAPFLCSLHEEGGNVLTIEIEIATSGEKDESDLAGVDEPVRAVVKKYHPITHSGRRIRICFENYILYQVRNESFAVPCRDEVYTGRYLREYEHSLLLKYLGTVTNACQGEDGSFWPGLWKHYGICTQDQIIDVVSHEEPMVTIGSQYTKGGGS